MLRTSWLHRFVWFLVVIFFVVAWPISKLLDCLLGSHHATFFRRSEIKAIVDIHGPTAQVHANGEDGDEEALTLDEVLIIKVHASERIDRLQRRG